MGLYFLSALTKFKVSGLFSSLRLALLRSQRFSSCLQSLTIPWLDNYT